MRLHITKTKSGLLTIIKVDGQLKGSGVVELKRVCRSTDHPFVLHLSDLRSVDSRGIDLIKALLANGAMLKDVPLYIDQLMGTGKPRS